MKYEIIVRLVKSDYAYDVLAEATVTIPGDDSLEDIAIHAVATAVVAQFADGVSAVTAKIGTRARVDALRPALSRAALEANAELDAEIAQ